MAQERFPMIDEARIREGMERGESFVFLDLRSRRDFQNWQIKGQSLQGINVPFYDFKEQEVNDRFLTARSHVVLLSQEEPEARKVASRLRAKEYEVSVLQGGQQTWDAFYVQSTIVETPRMKLVQVHRLATGCLSYAVVTGQEVIVVDPARHIEQYLAIAERENAKITHVIDSHVHADHLSGALALLMETKATYRIPLSELKDFQIPVEPMRPGTMHIGSVDIHVLVMDTEGRAAGSALLVLGTECVLSGDTIAVGEVGIPDMPGSAQEWADKMWNVIMRGVTGLRNDVLILPAHFADIQAVNEGGYVGAMLGDLRKGAKALLKSKVLTFPHHPRSFVSNQPPLSTDIREINAGLQTLREGQADTLESELRH